jgi:hypothetical protein
VHLSQHRFGKILFLRICRRPQKIWFINRKSERRKSTENATFMSDNLTYTVKKGPPIGAGPNIQSDVKRLIFCQTDSFALCLRLWLMEFLIETTSFFYSVCCMPTNVRTCDLRNFFADRSLDKTFQ